MKFIKMAATAAITLMTLVEVASAGTCRKIGCESCAISLEEMDNNLDISLTGNELPSHVAGPSGDTLFLQRPGYRRFSFFRSLLQPTCHEGDR